ncbi:hypothetical protein PR048_024909 [Dryococelus australis]|uniref:C2 domain-containing protein n=1 Tax=Dryococelus australis TaxID=614101 RepID=A0ABQ9GPW3_9NEOP|nr:hypothetical protein PR048_024909 [Dryococelus australis]
MGIADKLHAWKEPSRSLKRLVEEDNGKLTRMPVSFSLISIRYNALGRQSLSDNRTARQHVRHPSNIGSSAFGDSGKDVPPDVCETVDTMASAVHPASSSELALTVDCLQSGNLHIGRTGCVDYVPVILPPSMQKIHQDTCSIAHNKTADHNRPYDQGNFSCFTALNSRDTCSIQPTITNVRREFSDDKRSVTIGECRFDPCIGEISCKLHIPPCDSDLLFLAWAAVAERLARSPPTKVNRAQSPAGSPDFRKWDSCRTMPLVGGFSQGSPTFPALSFRRRSIFTSITLIDSEDLAVKSRPNLFTHSVTFNSIWISAGMKGRAEREIPEKTSRPTASFGTIRKCGNLVTQPGIELGSPWREASDLTTRPPRHQERVKAGNFLQTPHQILVCSLRNEDGAKLGKTGVPRENPLANGNVHQISHIRKSGRPLWRTELDSSWREPKSLGYWTTAIPYNLKLEVSDQQDCLSEFIKFGAKDVRLPRGFFSAFDAERRGSVKGDTATRIKSHIAAKHEVLNWQPSLMHGEQTTAHLGTEGATTCPPRTQGASCQNPLHPPPPNPSTLPKPLGGTTLSSNTAGQRDVLEDGGVTGTPAADHCLPALIAKNTLSSEHTQRERGPRSRLADKTVMETQLLLCAPRVCVAVRVNGNAAPTSFFRRPTPLIGFFPENIWAALNIEVLRADEGGARRIDGRRTVVSRFQLTDEKTDGLLTDGRPTDGGLPAHLPPMRSGLNARPGHRIFASGNRAGRCRWSAGFLGDIPFPPPSHSDTAPYSLQSPSSTLNTTMLRVAQISSLTQLGDSTEGGRGWRQTRQCTYSPFDSREYGVADIYPPPPPPAAPNTLDESEGLSWGRPRSRRLDALVQRMNRRGVTSAEVRRKCSAGNGERQRAKCNQIKPPSASRQMMKAERRAHVRSWDWGAAIVLRHPSAVLDIIDLLPPTCVTFDLDHDIDHEDLRPQNH